jgi:hypothetical protein
MTEAKQSNGYTITESSLADFVMTGRQTLSGGATIEFLEPKRSVAAQGADSPSGANVAVVKGVRVVTGSIFEGLTR